MNATTEKPVVESPTKTINGQFHVWTLGGQRAYADIHLPFSEAREYIQPVRYDAIKAKGEQREMIPSHAKKIKGEMLAGNYTPTQISASLRKDHREFLQADNDTREFTLKLLSDNPIAQTDGSHRYGALEQIVDDSQLEITKTEAKLGKTESTKEIAALQATIDAARARIDQVMNTEIGVRIYFDGDPQRDFINLQATRTVDKSHMLSLRIMKGLAGDDSMKLALLICKHIAKLEGSPFRGLVRFDSKTPSKESLIRQLPVSSLMGRTSSDLATSLVGLARLGTNLKKTNSAFLAQCVVQAYLAIDALAPELVEAGKWLTPPRQGGSKGSATMMIGLGICLAYHLITNEREEPNEEDIQMLADAAKLTLAEEITNGSSQTKREKIGDFARAFFVDYDESHDGIPTEVLKATSCSAWNAQPLPKAEKASEPLAGLVEAAVSAEELLPEGAVGEQFMS